jgi:hypothetical protein
MLPAPRPFPRSSSVSRPPLAAVLAGLLVLALALPGPARAAFLGDPTPEAPYGTFRHGLDLDRTVRKITSSRWNSPVTFRNTRLMARESYGIARFQGVDVNLSALFGISRAEIDFGTVDMQDGGTFWETYAPGTTTPGDSRRVLSFGDTFGSSWGAAVTARLLRFPNHTVSGGAQILYSQSTDTRLPAMRLRYNEWDFFLGTRWKQKYMNFYAGLDASFLVGELQLPDRATDLDQKNILGIYGGFKYRFYRHLLFSSELRLINQSSYSAQLVYTF